MKYLIGLGRREFPILRNKGDGLKQYGLTPGHVPGVHRLFECGIFLGMGLHPLPQLCLEGFVFCLAHGFIDQIPVIRFSIARQVAFRWADRAGICLPELYYCFPAEYILPADRSCRRTAGFQLSGSHRAPSRSDRNSLHILNFFIN